MDVVNWFLDPANWQGTSGIPNRLFEHLALAAVALVTATIIALPVRPVRGPHGPLGRT